MFFFEVDLRPFKFLGAQKPVWHGYATFYHTKSTTVASFAAGVLAIFGIRQADRRFSARMDHMGRTESLFTIDLLGVCHLPPKSYTL